MEQQINPILLDIPWSSAVSWWIILTINSWLLCHWFKVVWAKTITWVVCAVRVVPLLVRYLHVGNVELQSQVRWQPSQAGHHQPALQGRHHSRMCPLTELEVSTKFHSPCWERLINYLLRHYAKRTFKHSKSSHEIGTLVRKFHNQQAVWFAKIRRFVDTSIAERASQSYVSPHWCLFCSSFQTKLGEQIF